MGRTMRIDSVTVTEDAGMGRSNPSLPCVVLSICALPGCASPRAIGAATFETGIAWTPDGRGVAFARDGNLWVQSINGGESRQLTRFTDTRPIGSFCVVARWQAPRRDPIDRHQRHRPLEGLAGQVIALSDHA